MKFSHSLQFNAVPEWSNKYINYSQLKKIIYILQKEVLYPNNVNNNLINVTSGDQEDQQQQIQPLLRHTSNDTELDLNHQCVEIFIKYLNKELIKCDNFFKMQEDYYLNILNDIMADYDNLSFDKSYVGQVKKRLLTSYTQFNELKSYLQLNHTGFVKICKKFDKVHHTNLKSTYIDNLHLNSTIFKQVVLEQLNECIFQILTMYASISSIDVESAEEELASSLRDHLVWERNTVWKDMMNLETKQQTLKKQIPQRLKNDLKNGDMLLKQKSYQSMKSTGGLEGNLDEILDADENNGPLYLRTNDDHKIEYWDDFKKFTIKDLLKMFLSSKIPLISGISFFVYQISYNVISKYLESAEQTHCLFVLLLASLFWSFEVFPLFVTSLIIPFLLTALRVFKDEKTLKFLSPKESASYIMSTMWNSVIMLLLGGFTLAATLSKHDIARLISTYLLSKSGTSPYRILLMNMSIAVFCSMWISNIATPVLCYGLIQPILRTLPRGSVYAKWLILGIGFSSNIGGMSSPISSPQNIISIGLMDKQPSWEQWFFMVLPVCVLNVLGIFYIITKMLPLNNKNKGLVANGEGENESESGVKIIKIHFVNEKLSITQWYVVIISIITVLFWCLNHKLEGIFGDMGMISIFPIVAFFGTGVLTTQDFNSFMWNIVILTMGGTTLGKAVINTGLLRIFAEFIAEKVDGLSLFKVVLIFGLIIVTLASFISHTVAAMILAPLMKELGKQLQTASVLKKGHNNSHADLLVLITALLCSAAAALPTSGFPNLCAISMCDDLGDKYLNVKEFIKLGFLISVFGYATIVTLGFILMQVVGY
ncbi:hypothetical protein QEN19_003673 [Hanseniaspora menglaensis]